MTDSLRFPEGFVFGAATAAYQIEGAVGEDGRGESIWDRFSHTPGKVYRGDTGDVACDHYHRWESDIELMQELNFGAYRFSIAWPRIIPTGTGAVNQAGLDFYSRLVDELLEVGIQPHATLYHWDLPQALEDQGGWPARATAEAFVEYAAVVTEALGDRLATLATFNEPFVVANHGYYTGEHAPGRSSSADYLATSHHLMVAHGMAVQRIREIAPDLLTGIVLNFTPMHAASDDPLDLELTAAENAMNNRWYLEPIAGRGYPAEGIDYMDWTMDEVLDGDLDLIAQPIDFLGVNYYTRGIQRHPHAEAVPTTTITSRRTGFDWEIYPDALRETLEYVHGMGVVDRIYITENGAAFPDDPDDVTVDHGRLGYLRDHLTVVHSAVENGIPVKGYLAWSLLDNFEWALGYSQRFGIVRVDFDTLERTPRQSARWYGEVARTGVIS